MITHFLSSVKLMSSTRTQQISTFSIFVFAQAQNIQLDTSSRGL